MSRMHVESQLKQSNHLISTQLPHQQNVVYSQPQGYYTTNIPIQSQYMQNTGGSFHQTNSTQSIPFNQQVTINRTGFHTGSSFGQPIPGNISVSTNDCDCLIHCPVCRIDYYCSQINHHMRRHYVADRYDFNADKDLSNTNDSVISYQQTTSYPLIEPLEFNTRELDEVAKGDQYKFIINENYDDFAEDHEPTERE
jgi:hypothetical protein